jgi:hypothetical protein
MKFPLDDSYFALNYNSLLDVYFKDDWQKIHNNRKSLPMNKKLKEYGMLWTSIYSSEWINFKGNEHKASLMVWKKISEGAFPNWVFREKEYNSSSFVKLNNQLFRLTLTFTPLAANSLLEVEVLVNAALNGTSNSGWVMLFDSGSATPTVAVALGGAALSYQTRMLPIKHFVVAGSVTQRTFTVRMSSANTTTFLNNSLSYSTPYFAPAVASSISVKEYAQ